MDTDETYLRLMFLKSRHGLGYEVLRRMDPTGVPGMVHPRAIRLENWPGT